MLRFGKYLKLQRLSIFILLVVNFNLMASDAQRTDLSGQLDELLDVTVDNEGNYYVMGQTTNDDVYATKIDSSGKIIWEQHFGGSGVDSALQFILHPSNYIVIVGATYSDDFEILEGSFVDQSDVFPKSFLTIIGADGKILESNFIETLTTTPSANPLFEEEIVPPEITLDDNHDLIYWGSGTVRKYSLSNQEFGTENWAIPIPSMFHDLQVDSNNDLVLDGWSSRRTVDVMKLSSNGQALWEKSYGLTWSGGGHSIGYEVKVDPNDNVYIAGNFLDGDYLINSPQHFGASDIVLAKFDPNGGHLWDYTIGSVNTDDVIDLFIDKNGDPIVIGVVNGIFDFVNAFQDFIDAGEPIMIAKYDQFSGDPIFATFSSTIGRGGSSEPAKFMNTASDLIIHGGMGAFTGTKTTENAFSRTNNGGHEVFLTTFNPDGTASFSTYLGGSDNDWFLDFTVDVNENIWLVGRTTSPDFPLTTSQVSDDNLDAYLTKWTSNGELLHSVTFGGDSLETPIKILTSKSGDIVILGTTPDRNFPNIIDSDFNYNHQFFFLSSFSNEAELQWTQAIGVERTFTQDLSDFIPIIVVISTVIIGFALYSNKHRFFKPASILPSANENINKILSPLFDSKPDLLVLFTGSTLIGDQVGVHRENVVPDGFLNFKEIMHPVRLSIIKLLYDNTRLTTVELKEMIGVDRVELNNNITSLRKSNFIVTEQGFVDGDFRTIAQLQPHAAVQFKQLKEMLMTFLSNAPNLDKYLEQALEIHSTVKNTELYPAEN